MFRLKKEAVPFFKESLATSILSWDEWENLHVDEKALEEIKPVYLKYGHLSLRSSDNSSTLCGWDEDGSKFHFTICFPSMACMEYDRFSNGHVVREMMDRIQSYMDDYFREFKTNKL